MQTKSTRKQEDRSTARYSRTPLAKSSKPSTGYQVAKDEEKRRDSQRSLESGSDDDKACDAMMDELSKLNSLRKKNKLPFETIWTSVLGIIESETWRQLAASKNLKEHKGDRIFLGVLLEIAKRGYIMVDEKKITAKDVIIIYRKHAAFKPWWPVILWMQLRSLVETPTLGLSTPPTQVAFAEKLSGLIKIWALYFESYRSKSSYWDRYMSGTGQIFEQEIERVSEAGLKPVEVSEEFENLPLALGARFGQLFGFGKNKPRFQPIALVAIFSLHFLELHMDKLENDQVILDAALTLRNSFRILEKNSAWDYESVRHHLRGVGTSRQDLEAAKAEWLGLSAQGSRNSPMSNVARRSPRVYFWTGHNIDRWFARANRLSSTEPPGIKDVIRFWHFSKDKLEKEQLEDPEIRDKIFARLFKLFFEVNRNDEAIEVWNYMLSSGVRPTKIHWTAMLAGCGRVRDLESMQGIWSNMLNSKFEPDNETWTAYIHGIVRAGQSQQGLALLEQLSHDWRSKIKSIQPSLGPVHGAMSAIHTLNRGRNSIIDFHKLVLNWARSQGLQPETFTYNIMLKTINLSATTDELQSHLKAMAEDNCKPDIITYTLILKGLVGSYKSPFFSLSEKDQVAAINSVLQSLSTNNMYPSPHTYSTLLFGLLDSREHPPAFPPPVLCYRTWTPPTSRRPPTFTPSS
ncbi:uncharacterized protein KY384_006656 [Bacidia gigantensis]|uniref:uncharacterized protein n=1 Tax=Bacidia gigantensis TaxID=2732470 RepID=UPI001D03A8BD|nr:uncharacterized protein KY384_006656 [Bacidia gigantensis]KAG8528967.1 hypothetical protein KY384_006656 [Bacidia gigantensis]